MHRKYFSYSLKNQNEFAEQYNIFKNNISGYDDNSITHLSEKGKNLKSYNK